MGPVRETKKMVCEMVKKSRGYIFMSFDEDGLRCAVDVRKMSKVNEDVRYELMRDLAADTQRVFETIKESFAKSEGEREQAEKAKKVLDLREKLSEEALKREEIELMGMLPEGAMV